MSFLPNIGYVTKQKQICEECNNGTEARRQESERQFKEGIQSLEPMALLDDAPPEIKQQFREAQAAMKVLISKLQAEGVDI